jgi:hypothetical protein
MLILWVGRVSDGSADNVTAAVWKQAEARQHDGPKLDKSLYTGTYHDKLAR